ncbi:MAG: site-specific integrase [Rhizomicrobium sp.]
MAFMMDTEEVKRGVVIFRRADVGHDNWYCRMRLPKQDRYKTVSLKTPYIEDARRMAGEQEIELRVAIKHDMPLFNRPFRQIAKDFLAEEELRAKAGQITYERVKRMRSVIESKLNAYVGSIQINLIGSDRWENYPNWRRAYGEGRMARPGFTRERTDDEVERSRKLADAADAAREKARRAKIDRRKFPKVNATAKGKDQPWIIVSDATIGFEMSIFGAVMAYAQRKRYVSAEKRFEGRLNLKKLRRDEFTLEEYRRLHTKARKWITEASDARSAWYREIAYNFMLIMCNTGMRPPEARNLRWRDITAARDREGRDLVVLFVTGKGKSRKLVAPASVHGYLERVRKLSKAVGPADPVFSTLSGKSDKSLYKHLIDAMLEYAELRDGPQGIPRSTYCFRHTYATLRLSEGVDVYFLAEQMGTSVKMIEEHYGHVNTIKHADRVLQGIGSWDPVDPAQDADGNAEADAGKKTKPAKKARSRKSSRKDADAKAARALAIRRRPTPPRTHA